MDFREISPSEENYSSKPKTIEELERWIQEEGYNLSFWDQEFAVPPVIRKFKDSDYELLKTIMNDYLSKFYDGHSDKTPLLDQLIWKEDRDDQWFFTKNKFILIYQNENWEPIWLIAINNKRGPSVKTWPLIVHEDYHGQGAGRTLKLMSELICRKLWAHKMYATTSYQNQVALKLNEVLGYKKEVLYTDQYKKWSNEVILGKILQPENELSYEERQEVQKNIKSVIVNWNIVWSYSITNASEEDISFLENIREVYSQRHDDLWSDFTYGMVSAQERWMNFQTKWKSVLVLSDEEGQKAMWTLTPKRWWPCKLYPLGWVQEAQEKIIQESEKICKEIWWTKIYSFVQEFDKEQYEFMISQWFRIAKNEEIGIWWIIQSAYKVGYNIIALEKMLS